MACCTTGEGEGHSRTVKEIVIDQTHPHLAYSASWDMTCREWNLQTGQCEQLFEGPTSDIIGLSQCDVVGAGGRKVQLLFAATTAGCFCWRKSDATLLAKFAANAYCLLATPTLLFVCDMNRGVLRFDLKLEELEAAGGKVLARAGKPMGGNYAPSTLGEIRVNPTDAAKGMAIDIAFPNADFTHRHPGFARLLCTGHVEPTPRNFGISLLLQANNLLRSARALRHIESDDIYYSGFVWDSATGECVAVLAGQHTKVTTTRRDKRPRAPSFNGYPTLALSI
jgi:hypothetical protein